MFAYIKGTLTYKYNDYIVVEANGVGYKLTTSLTTIGAVGAIGNEIKVFTHLHVREDIMCLYGFFTQEELSMFELLISVSGVGPKVAISLISTFSPSRFGLAIITDDIKMLTTAQGIGSKMAQRIILELKDKIKKEQLSAASFGKEVRAEVQNDRSQSSEAISALMVLGYSPVEASRAVAAAFSEEMDLESIIKAALRGLVR